MSPIEDGRHHLQRTELEALRKRAVDAEEAQERLAERIAALTADPNHDLIQANQASFAWACKYDKLEAELEALRAENADLKMLGEQQFDAGVQYSGIIAKLRTRIQELEGALKDVGCLDTCECCPGGCHQGGSCCVCPALESGTAPKSTNEGLKCPPGECAVGAAQTRAEGAEHRNSRGGGESVPVETVTAHAGAGAGTGEQVGREPSPMPEKYCRCGHSIERHEIETGGCMACVPCVQFSELQAPALKTFTMEEIKAALHKTLARTTTVSKKSRDSVFESVFWRALGLGGP